ncbi:MAG: biosynthetic peptidoglycan transglycosylase [Gemmatimonadales bacterium]
MMRLRTRQDAEAARQRRYQPVPLDSIARSMRIAAITGEDGRFWDHGGVDWIAILHAMGYRRDALDLRDARDRRDFRVALGRAWNRRDRIRGASTITQQLAKNLYLSPSRNPLRKVKEAVTAWRLELALGKVRILELYLNVAELGPEVWGVEAASRKYFSRPARRINQSQAAALAGSLPFPLRSNPGYRPGRMRWRQDLILRRMGGEPVEIPKEPEEPWRPVVLPDSLALAVDSLTVAPAPAADTLQPVPAVPTDTLPPVLPPADSTH